MSRRLPVHAIAIWGATSVLSAARAQTAQQITARIPLEWMSASDVAAQLRQQVAVFRLSTSGMPEEVRVPVGLTEVRAGAKNELVVTGTADAVVWVRDLIKRLDVKPAQVHVRVRLLAYRGQDDIPPARPGAPGALLAGKAGRKWLDELPKRLASKRWREVSDPNIRTVLGCHASISTGGVIPSMLRLPSRTPQASSGATEPMPGNQSVGGIAGELYGVALSVACCRNEDGTFDLLFVIRNGEPAHTTEGFGSVSFVSTKFAQGTVKLESGQPAVVLFPICEGENKRLAAVLSLVPE